MTENIRVDRESVYQYVRDAFISAGVTDDVAAQTADGLVMASMRGVDSHGIRLLPHYLDELEAGRINPEPDYEFEQTASAVGTLDADHTYGIAASKEAMTHAIELAEDAGAGHVVVEHSTHNGSMASFGLKAAREGMIGMASTHTSSNTRPPNSTRPFFGSNPICITAPMRDEGPFCYDGATSAITFNKVKKHRDSGKSLPPQVAADEDGVMTRDPEEVAQLLPMGGYKGFGLSMAVDMISGLLSGMSTGRDISEMYGESISNRRNLGHYVAAIRIDAFVDVDEFERQLQELAEEVRIEPRLDEGKPNHIPGDPEKDAKARRKKQGIPIPDHDLERFEEIASKYDVEPVV
jgi:ureidoglycolate dehydrogenase (NAD+)